MDCGWAALVILSSLHRLWPLPFEETTALTCGLALLAIGVATISAGAMEFRSLRKISGMEVSKLITTGIYRWSRNLQFLGLYLSLLGIALLGRSGYALLLTIVAIIWCHYYIVKVEEPYLKLVFEKEYLTYKSKTPRYIGIPKNKKKTAK